MRTKDRTTVVVSNAFGNSITSQVAVVTVQDTTGPVVALVGPADVTVECHAYPAFPILVRLRPTLCEGVSSIPAATGGSANLNAVGDYVLSYTASDSHSNPGNVVTRNIHVRDSSVPNVALIGGASINVECHTALSDRRRERLG